MTLQAKQIADNASFQAFVNCYLREIDAGVWHDRDNWHRQTAMPVAQDSSHVLELQLTHFNITLALNVSYRSLVGRHTISSVYKKADKDWTWQQVDSFSSILLLIEHIYHKPNNLQFCSADKEELLARTIESQQVMHHYIEQRDQDEALNSERFIDTEQSLLFGHWLHPTPKSRQGIHHWQHQDYTPELKAQFQLHFFAVDKELVRQSSRAKLDVESLVMNIVKDDNKQLRNLSDSYQLIPVHPLQAHWLIHQDYIKALIKQQKLINIGPLGLKFSPTSSVRTLYNPDLDYMVKVSIPVKITNSLRNNREHELDAGFYVGEFIKKSGFYQDSPQFSIIDDPAYITANLPGMEESGFEVIFRDNPFKKTSEPLQNTKPNIQAEEKIYSIAALVQNPLHTGQDSRLQKRVNSLAKKMKLSKQDASLHWFDCYWHCAIESAITLYDKYGLALEAHQQNSLLDLSQDYPSHYYYRDNQGFYLSQQKQAQLLKWAPNLAKTKDLFYDDAEICERFSYYLFINQLFSVINRFGIDGLISEQQLLSLSQNKLNSLKEKLSGAGLTLIDKLFTQTSLACKGNLLTRIDDVDELQAENELAVYTTIVNPFYLKGSKSKATESNVSKSQLNNAAVKNKVSDTLHTSTEALATEVCLESA